MTNEQIKEVMMINLRDWLLEMEDKARSDSDPVSIEGFTDDSGHPVGGLMLIRTPEAFGAVVRACEDAGLITPGKGIVDGTRSEDDR